MMPQATAATVPIGQRPSRWWRGPIHLHRVHRLDMACPRLWYGAVVRSPCAFRVRRVATDAQVKRKADVARNRKARHFVDTLVVEVQAGHGGDGCVAFHREKYVQLGPAAGGHGGTGGHVYVRCDPSIHSLARVPKRVVAQNGTHGEGDWLHGKGGRSATIHVPVGTTVRSLGWTMNERLAQAQPYLAHIKSARARKSVVIDPTTTPELAHARSCVWRHFPRFEDDNYERAHFAAAETKLAQELRAHRTMVRHLPASQQSVASQSRWTACDPRDGMQSTQDGGWSLDLLEPTPPSDPGVLLARGGAGGFGNPHFLLERYHAPKIATRGMPGESLLLALEYKQPSDMGLVGLPNAGKSTLLRCLSRADAEVGSYSFTTLRPNLGVMRLDADGHLLTEQSLQPESQRLVVADMPGLIEDASRDRGLGHDFLRHMERCSTLVAVVDIGPMNPRPGMDLVILRRELEAYRAGLSDRLALVVANKADLLGEGSSAARSEAQEKLTKLRYDVDALFSPRAVPVVPISAKWHLNIDRLVQQLHQVSHQD